MKVIQELPEIFEEFGEQRRKAFLEIKEYKDKRIPVVGMYCAYFPTELAMAVGAIPVGLCSFSNETVPAAEKELPKSMCPLVKSSYGFAIEDKCPFLHFADLVIGETTCDGKKKMYELLAEIRPVHVMELPNSQSERGVEFWKREVIRAKEYFEEFFHVVITEKMIRDAVHLNNQIRMSLKNLCEVMKLDPAPVYGEDIQKMVQGCKYRFDFSTTPQVVNEVRERILVEYQKGKKLERKPRILITGCPIGGDSLKVIRAIESNGGVVVAIENCSGVRTLAKMVDETQEDIYEAIARKYLSTGCSIMTPNDHRIELLGEIIDEYHVDGVVEMILTGCHSTGVESIYIRKFVNEEKHLPYISVDTDYSQADSAQISTRLAAFIEMIVSERQEQEHDQIDPNYCYKILLAGISGKKTREQVLEEIWQYTGIPFIIEDCKNGRVINFGVDEDMSAMEEKYRITKVFAGKQGKITGYITSGCAKSTVNRVLEIIIKSYEMKKRRQQEQDKPDYMWIVAENQKTTEELYQKLSCEDNLKVCVHKPEGTGIFISRMGGRKERDRLICLLKGILANMDEKIVVGNGFFKEESKEKNRELQQYALNLLKKKRIKEKIYLIENYYYEIAISYIGQKVGKNELYTEELARIKKEDEEKGKDLYDTLYWYLQMKRNTTQTAYKMKIHRNTLLPRIARLNEIIGVDEKDTIECEGLLMVMEIEKEKESVQRN